MINDRMTRGIIAGVVSAVVQDVYTFAARTVGFTKIDYEDFAEALIFSRLLPGFFPSFFGLIGHLAWNTFLGVVFVYLIKFTSSRYYVLKGLTVGVFTWWFVKVFFSIVRIPGIVSPSSKEVGVYLIGSLLFGLSVAYTLKLLDTRWERVS